MATKTKEESVKFWLNSCRDDFETAKAMLGARRYNYAMFMCQQALEELLKAIIVTQTNDNPPYIHDLVLLSKKINLKFPKDIQQNLRGINPHYIVARYKPKRFDPEVYNRTSAKKTIKITEEIIEWLIERTELRKYSGNS
jgi:HEPN domain-containing protein